MKPILSAILLSFSLLMSLATVSQPWEVDKSKDGIIVHTKAVSGSDFKSFKAVVLIDAAPADILKLLKDAESYTRWYGYTKSAQILKVEGDIQYNYVETTFPWPYENRDMVYRMSIDSSNEQETKVNLKGIPDYIPEKRGIVRMIKAEGHILLKPINGKTEITYVFHSEPGENIPVWLANSSIAELPYQTLLGLREMLRVESEP
ncbi:MAG: START domain-containing protein [Marinoscillum sp.]